MENSSWFSTFVSSNKKALCEVTTLSRVLAAVLFVILPFVGFLLGFTYDYRPSTGASISKETASHKSTPESDVSGVKVGLRDVPSDVVLPPCSTSTSYECTWKLLENDTLGIRLYVKDFNGINKRTYFVNGNELYVHRLADGAAVKGSLVLQVFEKDANQSIDEAIANVAYKELPQAVAFNGCRAVKTDKYTLSPEKEVYEYTTTGKYAAFVDSYYSNYDGKPGFDDCGRFYGEESRYFEYHPNETRTKFVFVMGGWSYPEELDFYPDSIALK